MADQGMSYLNFLIGSQIDLELAQARERIRQIRANAEQKKAAVCSGTDDGAVAGDGGHCRQHAPDIDNHSDNRGS